MKYENFIKEYADLQSRAMELSEKMHILFPKRFYDLSEYEEFDSEIYEEKNRWMYSIDHVEQCWGDDNHYWFNCPLSALFGDEYQQNYIDSVKEEERIKKEKITEEKILHEKKEEEERLKDIEWEKAHLVELMKKYPKIVNEYGTNK